MSVSPDDRAGEGLGQPRPLRAGVREDAVAPGSRQRVPLQGEVLVGRRDSCIAEKHASFSDNQDHR